MSKISDFFNKIFGNRRSASSAAGDDGSPKSKGGKKVSRKAHNRRVVRVMWSCFGIFVAFILLLFVLIYNGVIGYMPPVEELQNPTDKFASTVYSADGIEMTRYYSAKEGNRVYVDFDQMSKYLSDALIATEDVRFEEHSGIDVRAILRSFVKRVLMGQHSAGGGSTITQQLAKQLYSPKSSNIFDRALQKPIEWVIAMKLERYYTKEEIIKMYFNQFDFLNNAVGIKTAAEVYFGKLPKDLNIQESALLVGMCKNPALYNPRLHPKEAIQRRNVVLEQMWKAGMITEQECDSIKQLPSGVSLHIINHNDAMAPYFCEELRRIMMAREPRREDYPSWNYQAYVTDSAEWQNNPLYGWCNKNRKSDGTNYNIYTDGLKIYTTIDSRMQAHAEAAALEHMATQQKMFTRERGGEGNPYTPEGKVTREQLVKRAIRQSERYRALKAQGMSEDDIMENFNQKIDMHYFSYDGDVNKMGSPLDSLLRAKTYLRCGLMSMDPHTGHVKAYVGGVDFHYFKYDMVSRGARQVGSSIKPYIFAIAMQNLGLSPNDTYNNSQPDYGGWRPKGHGGGVSTLKSALTVSSNFMPPHLMHDVGAEEVVKYMHEQFGITAHLDPYLSLSLGAAEITLKEMVSAYSTFANHGERVSPIFVTRICDNRGNLIADFRPRLTRAISEDTAWKMVDMLQSVANNGTGRRVRAGKYAISSELGGKTGTTNNNADAWFMGFLPDLVTGVWVGGEDRYVHFASTANGQGAALALPMWQIYNYKILNDKSLPYSKDTKFNFPKDYNPGSSSYVGHGGGGGGGDDGGGGGGDESINMLET